MSDDIRLLRQTGDGSASSSKSPGDNVMYINEGFDQYSIGLAQQRTSYVEEDLSDDERKFLWLVTIGDIEGVRALIKDSPNLSVDSCDYRGQRALDIAVSNHDVEVVEFLLRELKVSVLHYYSAILRAVLENEISILGMLLDRAHDDITLRQGLKDLIGGGSECSTTLPEIASSSMTPLMVAATKGNVEITRLLLERGYCIQKPHDLKCRCQDHCAKRSQGGESLTESMSRMNAYRALASPTYLILTSEDPILSAFLLSRDLETLSNELPENQKEYRDLSNQCSAFAASLLNQCRDTEEVQSVLTQRKGFEDPRPHRFSRLHLAVQCRQKEFVTHPNCQQVLRSMWVEGLGSWYSWSFSWRALHVIQHAFLTPLVSMAFIFIPKADVIRPLRVPLNRFIYFTTAYLVFLCLLLVTLLNDRRYDVHSPATWSEVAVAIWVLGHIWAIVLNLYSLGLRNYFRSWWSSFDIFMFSLFLTAELLWFSVFTFYMVHDTDAKWNRMDWPWYHPILLGEGIYATASVMAFSRLLLWCQVSFRLGPLGTSLRYMFGDVVRFFVLFFVIMFAFATGINSIYKNYKHSTREEDQQEVTQPEEFLTLKSTFKTLFWAIFGMAEPDFADIVVSANKSLTPDDPEYNDHYFSEAVGYGLWGVYHLLTVVVLLNMLIGMMAESYQRVVENTDMEWKYACSILWLSMFDSHSVVPPPFNLIPSMHRVAVLFRWMIARKNGKVDDNGKKVSWSPKRCCYWDPEPDHSTRKQEEEKYEKLMVQLVRRYLHSKHHQEAVNSSPIPPEVIEKIKSDVLNDLRKSLIAGNNKLVRRSTITGV